MGASKRAGSRRAGVFYDESGVTTEMTGRYRWAPRPERVSEAVPAGHWRTLTVLAALGQQRLAGVAIESPTDGDVFLAFVEQVLGPRLQPGHLVILDNLSAHKVEGVRQLIESRGAQLLYLPPYSPDFNPIEQAWSKVKQLLRGVKARVLEQLEPAISQAFSSRPQLNTASVLPPLRVWDGSLFQYKMSLKEGSVSNTR